MTSSRLSLSGMHFHAFHGCLPEEAVEGGEYVVDFSCALPPSCNPEDDNLDGALDYSAVYRIVSSVMGKRVNLIETLAGNIVSAISEEFPALCAFTVRVSKLNPPVGGPCDAASVELEFQR